MPIVPSLAYAFTVNGTSLYRYVLFLLSLLSSPYLTFCLADKYGNVYGLGGQTYLYYHEEDESSFQLVDTTKVQKPLHQKGRPRFNQVCVHAVLVASTCT